ncbi:MAG: hypothetical protein OXN25_10645 [Candidatus Poribacteria bacterium]|nr:hypothetical protein [Candidatus Poribacteria bacterium]
MIDFWYVARSLGILCLIMAISSQSSAVGQERFVETESNTQPPYTESRKLKAESQYDEANIVRSLVISGNNSFSDQQIRALMGTDVWSVYDETLLKADFEAIVRFYRENGYQFARIIEEQLSVKKFGDGIYLGIEIDEGNIGQILVSGNIQTKEEVIRRELLFAEGDIYTEADRIESEQILRRKTYIGAAKVDAQWDELSKRVIVHASITELLSFPFGADLNLNNQKRYWLLQFRDPNLFGSGQSTLWRYERISEIGERTRSLVRGRYSNPRLFNSHWNFDGEYIQKRDGDSLLVLLERPQYTLKSRWSASIRFSESVNPVTWYENGRETDRFEQNLQGAFANVQRYFGDRRQQNYIGLWATSRRLKYVLLDKSVESGAMLEERDIKRVGFTLGRKHTAYHKTRFLQRMGQEENFLVGAQYALSLGYASPLYGSDRTESYAELAVGSGWMKGDRFFGLTTVALNTNLTSRIERSVLQARTSWFYTDVFNTGDIYTLERGFRENGLFDFHQTFVAQLTTEMQFGWSGRSQVLLGAFNGLRGYDYRQFNGEKLVLLNLESRTVFGGTIFHKMDEALAAVATFVARPFIDRPVHLGFILSGVVFADIGYIWNGRNSFDLAAPKRSVGFGLRSSLSQFSGTGILRVEFAFPLDPPFAPSLKPRIFYGQERTF